MLLLDYEKCGRLAPNDICKMFQIKEHFDTYEKFITVLNSFKRSNEFKKEAVKYTNSRSKVLL